MSSEERELLTALELHALEHLRASLDRGVDVRLQVQGKTPVDWLLQMYTRSDGFAGCLRLLLDRGGVLPDPVVAPVLLNDTVELKRRLRETPSLLTYRSSLVSAFSPLLGVPLLHVAAEYGHLAVARVLVEAGADVNARAALTTTGHGPPGIAADLTQPRGHRGGSVPVEPGPFADNPPYLGPSGRLHMTVGDLARWGQAQLRGARGLGGLVTTASFTRLHRPYAGGGKYALGWVEDTSSGSRVLWHDGSNTLWYAIVAFAPELDRGIVLISNGGIEAAVALEAGVRRHFR